MTDLERDLEDIEREIANYKQDISRYECLYRQISSSESFNLVSFDKTDTEKAIKTYLAELRVKKVEMEHNKVNCIKFIDEAKKNKRN